MRRRSWGRAPVVVLTLAIAGAATIAIVIISYLKAHFDCGGTFGGYGAAPDDHLDRVCLRRRQYDLLWLIPVVWVFALGGLLLAARSWRRHDPDDPTG